MNEHGAAVGYEGACRLMRSWSAALYLSACVLRARIEMIEAQVAVRAHAASILIESDCCAHCTHSSCSALRVHRLASSPHLFMSLQPSRR